MNIVRNLNTRLSSFSPITVYAVGAADATLVILIGFLLSKISQ